MDLAALRAIDGLVDAMIPECLIAPELDPLAGIGAFEQDWRHRVIMPLGQEAALTWRKMYRAHGNCPNGDNLAEWRYSGRITGLQLQF
jgi:hypothetical protein